MYWNILRRGQLDAFDRLTPVIFPVAAVEQHGDHLPLGTDCLINEAICARVNEALPNQILILPMQKVGCSEHHMSFPGSLTFKHETFLYCVSDVAESVVRHGFRRLLLLNSHGGNQAIDGVIGEHLGQRFNEVEFVVTNWWNLAAKELEQLQEGPLGSVGHACEFETSIMLAIAPNLVDSEQIEDGGIQHRAPQMHFDMLHSAAASCYRSFDRLSHNGVFGKPSLATAEKGRKILTIAAASLCKLLNDFWNLKPNIKA